MYASRGPAPKRSDERRRRNKPEGMDEAAVKAPAGAEPLWLDPPGDPDDPGDSKRWHYAAEEWYLSLQEGGMVAFYEPSDAMTAYILAEELSRLLKPQFVGMQDVWNREAQQMEHKPAWIRRHISGSDLSAVLKGMTNLGATEADRRRMRIELQRADDDEQTQTPGEAEVARTQAELSAPLTLVQGGKGA